jgi:hypothetical protein
VVNPDWSDCDCSAYHFADKGSLRVVCEASGPIEADRARIPRLRITSSLIDNQDFLIRGFEVAVYESHWSETDNSVVTPIRWG